MLLISLIIVVAIIMVVKISIVHKLNMEAIQIIGKKNSAALRIVAKNINVSHDQFFQNMEQVKDYSNINWAKYDKEFPNFMSTALDLTKWTMNDYYPLVVSIPEFELK